MQAAANGHIGCVKLLLERGCNLDQTSIRGRCALHLAVWHNHLNIVHLLLANGCNTELRECYGDTPLMMCAQRGFSHVIAELLKAGSNTMAVNDERDIALHLACRYGHTKCVRLLVKGMPFLEVTNMWGVTPLFYAVMYGHTEVAKCLVEAGANVQAVDRHDKTLLHHAAEKDLVGCVATLLNEGVAPDWVCGEKKTALVIAVRNNFLQTVKLLIQANCNVDLASRVYVNRNIAMMHPLETAVRIGHASMAKLLVQGGTRLEPLRSLHVAGEVHEALLKDSHFISWMHCILGSPRSLLLLCRHAIGRCLSHRLAFDVTELPLPTILQNFLAYKDLDF